jgi:catecholate siderophore receptor
LPAASTIANLNDNTVVNRRTNAKSGEEHHTFCKAIPTTTQWFGLKLR